MKSLLSVIICISLGFAISSCGGKKENAKVETSADTTTVADTNNTAKAEPAPAPKAEPEVAPEPEPGSPYDKVTKWEISITSVISFNGECTEDVMDRKVVTNPSYVAKLNKMMQQKKYREYASSVKISGTTAKAKWYGGNRGGGIADDFPSDIANYLVN